MLIAINLLLGVAALAGIAWDVATGQLGSMDGNFLIAVCMLLAAIFLGGFVSSVRHGELARTLQRSREKGKGKATDQNV